MLTNENDGSVVQKIAEQCDQAPCLTYLVEAIKRSEHPIRIVAEDSGLTVAADNAIEGKPNRGIFKAFFPEQDKLITIFYKKSLVSFSRDRYSYGGIAAAPNSMADEPIDDWLEFLNTGFDPAKRPPNFQRAFPYDLPTD